MLSRRLRRVHPPPPLPAAPSARGPHHQSARAALPGGAPAHEDHPARLRGAAGAHADVRRRHPRGPPVAGGPRPPVGERRWLTLMYAAVIRAADRWRGLPVGEFEQRQLRAIREELDRAHTERTPPAVRHIPSASPAKLSSKART